MYVKQLRLQLWFNEGRLREFTCRLAKYPPGFQPETGFSLMSQILLPFLLAGIGMVAAGIVMDMVQVGIPADPRPCGWVRGIMW